MKLFSLGEFRSVWDSLKVEIFTTRLFVDPLAVPLVVLISKFKWITPNKVSLFALLTGGVGSYFFLSGEFMYGALGYYIFFLFDSIDGKLARFTSTFDPLGAFYDFAIDRIVIVMLICGMWISFIRLEMFSESAFAMAYIVMFLLKDVLDLKWKENSGGEKFAKSSDTIRFCTFTRFKMHFKPGQLLSCFIVFIIGPLSNAYSICLIIGILCLVLSIIYNVIFPYLQFIQTKESFIER